MGPKARPITPEIQQVGGPGLTAPEDAAQYLVRAGDQAALIDAGCGEALDRLVMNLDAAGVLPDQVRYLLLTHCHYDHSGGAAELHRRFGWPVGIHALDAPFLEAGDRETSAASWYGARLEACPVALRLADGDRIALGPALLEVIHIPGHSPGSVAFLMESAGRRVLFGQDVHGPLHPALRSNAEHYQASLRRLLALNADILCEGHYGVIRGQAAVAQFIGRFLED